MISVEDLYVKCIRCKKELRIYELLYYQGSINSSFEVVNDYVYCSIDCIVNDYQEQNKLK